VSNGLPAIIADLELMMSLMAPIGLSGISTDTNSLMAARSCEDEGPNRHCE
jgi:hypothetical protein